MEKERFLGTGALRFSAAWRRSVGVGGGEDRRLEFKEEAGEKDLRLEEDVEDEVGEKRGG